MVPQGLRGGVGALVSHWLRKLFSTDNWMILCDESCRVSVVAAMDVGALGGASRS